MKVSLFSDFPQENWPSMQRYAYGLTKALADSYPKDEYQIGRPRFWHGLDRYHEVFKKFPLLRFWANDLFLNRYINYSLYTKFHYSNINHILDHSYSHLIPFLPRGRTVVTCHDLIPLKIHNPALPKNKYLRLFEGTVKNIRKTNWIIADSKATKADLITLYGVQQEKVEVIYPGLNPQFKTIEDSLTLKNNAAAIGLLENESYILHVGVNHPYKNVETIFKVLKKLRDFGIKIKLIKAGQDFTNAQKQLIKDLGIFDLIVLFLNPSDKILNIIYNSSSVLLYPSLIEGFGWPILEALSCGLPVVCSDRGSLGEVGGNCVFYSDPCDPEAITTAISEALELRQNPQFLTKQKEWQDWVKQFSWETTAKKTHQVYERVLSLNDS